MRRYLAIDLGAESGRAVVGTLDGGAFLLEEIHRFPNGPVRVTNTLYWDILYLYRNICEACGRYVQRFGDTVDGIGIDSWGVDFGLLDRSGKLQQNPVCYRDARTEGMPEIIEQRLGLKRLFELTGIAPLSIYTACQLLSLRMHSPELLDSARHFLMIPDLLNYFLCGSLVGERSNAITTQLYDPHAADWSDDVFESLDLPRSIMPKLVDPGTVIGELRPEIKRATGLRVAPVIAPCTHDTGSAISAAPVDGDAAATVSCGTWSAVAMDTDTVIATESAFHANICNELSMSGLFACRNLTGLWILRQAKPAWERRGCAYTYADLIEMAESAPPNDAFILVDDPAFQGPPDMTTAITQYCHETHQAVPDSDAAMARCIIESVAMSFGPAIEQLTEELQQSPTRVHIVGGGSLNPLLCQIAANVLGVPVTARPSQASILGNLLAMARADGALGRQENLCRVVRASDPPLEFEPVETAFYAERFDAYRQLLRQRILTN